jgi:hypothetical protein
MSVAGTICVEAYRVMGAALDEGATAIEHLGRIKCWLDRS